MEIIRTAAECSRFRACCFSSAALRIIRYSFFRSPVNLKVKMKNPADIRSAGFLRAGAEGFEPSTKVLETHVLPLHHAPACSTECIILQPWTTVKHLFLCSGVLFYVQLSMSRVRSYIMTAAATAAFRDSAPPRIGSFRRWVASSRTEPDIPFPSLPTIRTSFSPSSPR